MRRAAEELMRFDFHYRVLSADEKAEILDRLRDALFVVETVTFAYVHGSFLSNLPFRDVDVAMWVSEPGRAFWYAVNLSARLSWEIGLPIDVHVLNEAPLPFRYRVFRDGLLLFSRDEELRLGELSKVFRMYFDMRMLWLGPRILLSLRGL